MWTHILQYVFLVTGFGGPKCKPIPGDSTWPTSHEWQKLNQTLSGRLISPSPPGGVCHPTYPTFDPVLCPVVAAKWRENSFHTTNPISNIINNWNNDSCLPITGFPCSGAGYPIYVVNATSAKDVKEGVDFARKTGVRLIIKGTGHDYLGRSQAPNALSIWTYYLKGLEFHEKGAFKPKSCPASKLSTAAITVGIGVPMIEINAAASERNLTILSGGAATVGLGGFITGGGHSALSPVYGLAADNVVEFEVVTPKGEIVTANECLNEDLFWALRGGGGSTFGVITSVTIRAFPSFRYASVGVVLATPSPFRASFWSVIATFFSSLPNLADQGISAYINLEPNYDASALGIPYVRLNGIKAIFHLPLIHPENSTAGLLEIITSTVDHAKRSAGSWNQHLWKTKITSYEHADFYANFRLYNGPQDGGKNVILSSRLLDRKALTSDEEALARTLQGAAKAGAVIAYLIAGPGVHSPPYGIPGGSNAVNSAWRKAYLHTVLAVSFPPLNTPEKERQHRMLRDDYMSYLRELAPDSGAYLNEADPEEPDYELAFWGENYERLVRIKREVDPQGVFWCDFCVDGGRWELKTGKDGRERVCRP